MSRGWIIGIVCLAISGTSVLACWAQDGRSQKGEALSLTARLAAVRDKFRRDKTVEVTDREPTRQNTSRANSALRRQLGGSADSQNDSMLPRVQPSELLPENLGERGQSDSGNRVDSQSDQSVRMASTPRTGGVTAGPVLIRQLPKSRSTASENELDSALADLASAEEAQASDRSAPPSEDQSGDQSQSNQEVSVRLNAAPSNTFDVHEALVADDEEETDAEFTELVPDFAERAKNTRITIEEPAIDVEEEVFDAHVEPMPTIEERQSPLGESSQEVVDSFRVTDQLPLAQQEPLSRFEGRESERSLTPQKSADPFDALEDEAFIPETVRQERAVQPPTRIERHVAPVQQRRSGDDLLLSYQQPVIVSHVEGPRQIMVGREATYQVTLENASSSDSKDLSASIRIPEWAEVVDAMSTSGVVERGNHGIESNVLDWRLHELAAKSSANLRLRLIPRSGQPLQLGIQWTQAPVASQTVVEVQEPKLQIDISGPQKVYFGKPQRYRLTLRNPGTGPADQLVVQLVPPGGDPHSATSQAIGTLKSGEVKEIELELTAREAGELIMQASATAAGDLTAEAVKSVLCLKPELQLDWRGPETKYAGTVAAYHFRVRNPGTAMTEPVTVRVQLPEGAQFEAASDGYEHDPDTGVVAWQLAGIAVGEEKFMQVRCLVDKPGANSLEVTAQTGDGGLQETEAIHTNVVALADLKLGVSDPQGPIALGESVLYEIRVNNRGKTAAEGVSVVGLFSAGIDPTSVEGAQYTVRDGRVTFHPITSLPAGREIVLRIRAKANQAGTHIFRAEVACQDLDIKLAAEETTRFFEDEYSWDDSQTPHTAENSGIGGRY